MRYLGRGSYDTGSRTARVKMSRSINNEMRLTMMRTGGVDPKSFVTTNVGA